ncbi:MAG: 2-hydroxychromene-2-carboxylate isomerase [Chloroflexota bacterium]
MGKTIDFFFDLSSPWTCLAFYNIKPILEKTGAKVIWRPFLVGGVHNAVNQAYPESRSNNINSPKWRQTFQALIDWSAATNVTMNFPGRYFPLRSVQPMRFCCTLEANQPALVKFADACFKAYFTHQLNLDDPAVLVKIANDLEMDGEGMRAKSQEQAIKDHLRANTDEAITRGAFGAPAIFVPFGDGERLYFGNDQLPLVKWAINQP